MTRWATHWSERTKLVFTIIAWLAIACILAWLAVTDLDSLEKGRSICLIKNLTGHRCPGCGTTRAMAAILHGQFVRAYHYNRLIIVVFPLLSYIAFRNIYGTVKSLRNLHIRNSVIKKGYQGNGINNSIS